MTDIPDIVIPLARQSYAHLRVGVDRRKPIVWFMFRRTSAESRREGAGEAYPFDVAEIPAFVTAIVEARTTGRDVTYQCRLRAAHALMLTPDRHPVDARREGSRPGALWIAFLNTRRAHEARTGRRADLAPAEVGRLIEALETQRDALLARPGKE